MTSVGPPRACGYCGEAFCYCHPDPDQRARVEQLDRENARLRRRIERMVADNLLHASGKCCCHGEGTCNYCQMIRLQEELDGARDIIVDLRAEIVELRTELELSQPEKE